MQKIQQTMITKVDLEDLTDVLKVDDLNKGNSTKHLTKVLLITEKL